jgi:flagellar hook protein FlgE
MMRSLFAGVSGLKNHQTRMDVIGNNIANVNTVGFKAARVNFQDILSQTLQGASSGNGGRGGTNPIQVGLGMGLASIDTIFTDGSFQPTGKATDLSIKGQGFFVLSDGTNEVFTRAGNFDFDSIGNFLVPGTGYKVMGWTATNGVLDTSTPVSAIKIPVGTLMAPKQTTRLSFANNLSSAAAIGASFQATKDVYDSLGGEHSVKEVFQKVGTNTWLMGTSVEGITGSPTGRLKEITFAADGSISSIKDVTALPSTQRDVEINGLVLDDTPPHTSSFTINIMDNAGNPHTLTMEYTATGTAPATSWDFALKDGATTLQTLTGVTAGNPPTTIEAYGTTLNLSYPGGVSAGTFSAPTTTVADTPWNKLTINNLNLNNTVGSVSSFNLDVTDEGLQSHKLEMRYTATATGWNFELLEGGKVLSSADNVAAGYPTSITVNGSTFDLTYPGVGSSGTFTVPSISVPTFTSGYTTATGTTGSISFTPDSGANTVNLALDFNGIRQYGGDTTVEATEQDGYSDGTLDSTTIDPDGIITGIFTNGQSQILGRVALATFNNPAGLNKMGDNLFVQSNNSGDPQIGTTGTGGRGTFNPGTLEMANVDIAQEFSNMIITQRGFQANSKIISVTDEMLQELANLKR